MTEHKSWRLDLLAIIVALTLHAGAFVWWASRIDTLVNQLVSEVQDLKRAKDDLSASPAGRAALERIQRLEQQKTP